MSFQAEMVSLLGTLVDGNVFWDMQPDDFPPMASFILLSTSGGQAGAYVERKLPDCRHARLQVSVFAATPDERENLALQLEKTIVEDSAFPAAEALGAYITGVLPSHKLYSAIQLFGIWYKPL